jgi:hypothetical protein
MANANLHFQCSFELRAAENLADPSTTLIRTIRNWIQQAPRDCPPATNPAFFAGWFFNGGEWRAPGGNYHYMRTARFLGNGNERDPVHWAARYEHNCTTPGRTWRVDIGVTRLRDGVYRFSISTSHFIRPGFIGQEPAPPLPTSPGIVGWLLRSLDWTAFAGTERLQFLPIPLKSGEGMDFKARLENPDREAPIVLVARDFRTGHVLLDSPKLAWLLSGAAGVYESASTEVDKELEWCLGRRFSCWNGMVRIYQPGLRLAEISAARRQRYFSGHQILEMGVDSITEILVRGVARRAESHHQGCVGSVEDITTLEREWRLAELKRAAEGENRDEWIKLLEETNSTLQGNVNAKDDEIRQLRNNLADSEDRAAKLDYDKKTLLARFSENEKEAKALRSRAEAASALLSLPESIAEAAQLVSRIHPDRIAFTAQGLDSAGECEFKDVNEAYRAFWAMSTHLHDLFFDSGGGSGDLEAKFYEKSGFRLAMTEKEITKENKKLMRQRSDVFLEEIIEITPHVKLDKDTTRVYFAPWTKNGKKLIVVGYIGHLDTSGTRRRK